MDDFRVLGTRHVEIARGVVGTLELQALPSGKHRVEWRQDGHSGAVWPLMHGDLSAVDRAQPSSFLNALDQAELIMRANPHAGRDRLD